MTNRVTPRLIVSSAADAIDFYRRAFGAEELERYTTPEGVVVHARIRIGESDLMLVDRNPAWGNPGPTDLDGTCVLLSHECEVDEVWPRALEHGAEVVFELGDRFYGERDGRLRDPFGHVWILTKTIEEMTPEAIQQGVDDFQPS